MSITNFNSLIKEMFNKFKDLPTDGGIQKRYISEIQQRMISVMRTEERYPITILGPLLWSARNEIMARNSEYFLKKNFALDVQKLCIQHRTNYDDAIKTVEFMKRAFTNAKLEDKEIIINIMIKLTCEYVDYVALEKKA